MAAVVEAFIQSPSETLLDSCTKDQLLKIADHFGIEIAATRLKDTIKRILKATLMEEGVLASDEGKGLPSTMVSPGGSLTFDQQKELLLIQMEHEKTKMDNELALEKTKMENELALEKTKMDKELALEAMKQRTEQAKLDIEQFKLDLVREGKMAGTDITRSAGSSRVDCTKNLRLLPKFDEEDPDTFFSLFERLADSQEWPDSERTLLLQCVFRGKAQKAYAALTAEQCKEYKMVKDAVLKAYELVPEAYRQLFRNWKKGVKQTHVDFERELDIHFDRWCSASSVVSFEELRNLVVLEQFKQSLPNYISTYINERKVKTPKEAAVLADEYSLTHKRIFGEQSQQRFRLKDSGEKGESDFNRGFTKGELGTVGNNEYNTACNFCQRQGHWKKECPMLKSKKGFSTRPAKSVGLAAPLSISELNTVKVGSPYQMQTKMLSAADIASKYAPFISDGFVSLVDSSEKVPVKIFRDSGAINNFIRELVLQFAPHSDTGSCVPVRGIGLNTIFVPVHTVKLSCNFGQGEVEVCVRPELPVAGVDIILGNEFAGACMWPEASTSDVTSQGVYSSAPVRAQGSEVSEQSVSPVCAVTRSMSVMPNVNRSKAESGKGNDDKFAFLWPTDLVSVSQAEFVRDQKEDLSLKELFEQAGHGINGGNNSGGYFLHHDLLMRRWVPHGDDVAGGSVEQFVLPVKYRQSVIKLAHDNVAGHMGVRKTYDRVLRHFFWPRLKREIASYIRTCHTCQLTGKPNQCITPAPLYPIPVISQPFEHLIIDCVGPLPRSRSGSQYLLTVMCQATRYPAVYPLHTISAKSVVRALSKFISVFGIPKVIQSDQGSNFTSRLFAQVLQQLHIKHNKSSVYHPQSQGALERFHQHLKSLLRAYCTELKVDWEEGLPWLLLAAREVVQESTGFSPNELVFAHTVRGPLTIVSEQWKSEGPPPDLITFVNGFRQRLYEAGVLAKEKLEISQKKMKRLYDRKVEQRQYGPGDQVLVLLPVVKSPFHAKFFGPCSVLKKVSEQNYLIDMPNKRKSSKICHVNLLKPYHARLLSSESSLNVGNSKACGNPTLLVSPVNPCTSQVMAELEEGGDVSGDGVLLPRLKNSETLCILSELLGHLDVGKRDQLASIIQSYPSLFSDTPSRTHLIEHDVDVGDAQPIKQRFYRLSSDRKEVLDSEVHYMLENGIAEPSFSAWSSPCLLVKKPDSTFRPCTDFRKVNAITKPDVYPLPRMEDCVDQVGAAKYVSKFDLLKGYWQVPLSKRAQEVCSFITPSGLYAYTVMPFGLRNAPATFQRLMNRVVSGLCGCAVYLDDVVIYSDTWEEHLVRMTALLDRLAWARLTINLAKCEFARATVTYLGKVVGQGEVRPVGAKVAAIEVYPAPSTRAELMRFLGLAGYYRCFCANFSSVATPLTNLLKAGAKYNWSPECQVAFEKVKRQLCSAPVLAAPQLGKPFQLQTDASNVGAGAVLLQSDGNGFERPVCYFSKKFKQYQLHYSVIEKEALALIWALQHFDVYIGAGAPLVVYTDHNPLTFLKSLQNPNQRLMRWALFLQPYHLDIRHIRGQSNVAADALSRAPLP